MRLSRSAAGRAMMQRNLKREMDMRALAVAGILGLFGLAAIFSMLDAHAGRGSHLYYVTADGNIDVSSSQRHGQIRHR